ncbi:cupin-like domain-containing protein [Sphingopyxis sp. XHP0097]|uniref:Cupin-like domain-containing protein n=1 Tax=Sphingopyxis jiangsuensis TaxID=2871171 RepID=A0ABS7MBX4_9SPHN|nr:MULTISPECIES: cupin-like domain-containing protein [Sphingopyxis]MBY4636525.1 cupin-like domain-containing protein [Sphingopyxis jiangsuensis]
MARDIREVDPDALGELTKQASEALEPVVVRGLASNTPVVSSAIQGDRDLLSYLSGLAHPREVMVLHANEDVEGKFGYSADLSSFNFRRIQTSFPAFLDALRDGTFPPGAVAVQGLQANHVVPGFVEDNAIHFLPAGGEYRLWLGTGAVVATHSDPAPNVAYVAAGTRRFTLFAPEEVGNLYMGPFDPVPNGTQISLADPMDPDPARFPRFPGALERSQTSELHPGDAIFIPTGWYHHVEATSPLNLLVNYWWRDKREAPSPWDALMHGFMALRGLSPAEKRVWRAMFDHYIFETNGDPGSHMPPRVRGILAEAKPQMIEEMRRTLVRSLSGPRG